jgi:DNA-binding MarR family transcriptional regulator
MDAETRVEGQPAARQRDLRLWLRLLTCTTLIETEIRRRLRREFAVTLPRFDLMAQLEKAGDGMTLGEVSRRMMVSNGNVTGLVEALVAQGLVERAADPSDRRATLIRLSAEGRRDFGRMARAHQAWIAEIFAGLAASETDALMALLSRTKLSARTALSG